ncbi:hypothetical protein [Cytobacillus praedii]|uniref:Uncharacterized protein n=1 Tax=Cytobacillus praedii TaxID=1742358 RepID=A0A4R1APX1_9BACI|nr:hypothetical protein [Cytobacillus praedii]TCJ01506.1 hypothetical protein E0Y62_23815 [Cytobacillus praedii]
MDIRIEYKLFKNVGGTLIAEKFNRFEVITVRNDLDPNSPEGTDEIKTELAEVIGEPKSNIKLINDYPV